ncbi:MAG TPA: flagellar protein FlgN [Phycisphaerales bacterium]|nr:flagellar protein FlgN [Phycisphaerales bacterium]
MSSRTDTSVMPAELTKLSDLLEHVLRNLVASQQSLLVCLDEKRTAVRVADTPALGSICARERTCIQRIEELDSQRSEIMRRLAPLVGIKANGAVRISAVADAIGEDAGKRLQTISQELRDLVLRVQKESSIVKNAMEALSRHLGGIVESVNGAMSRARVYGRKGRISVGVQLAGTVDLKS